MSKIMPERHSFEECYTNPLSPDFKPDTYRHHMLHLIQNRIDIPPYIEPSLLKPTDAQHCCEEIFMAAQQQVVQPEPARLEETDVEDQQLIAEQVTDVIASVGSCANAEDKCTPADYGHICREEILHCMGHAPSVQLLA